MTGKLGRNTLIRSIILCLWMYQFFQSNIWKMLFQLNCYYIGQCFSRRLQLKFRLSFTRLGYKFPHIFLQKIIMRYNTISIFFKYRYNVWGIWIPTIYTMIGEIMDSSGERYYRVESRTRRTLVVKVKH